MNIDDDDGDDDGDGDGGSDDAHDPLSLFTNDHFSKLLL